MDVDTVDERAADLLLVAGDGHGATTALFDRVAVEAAGAGVRIAAASTFLYDLCTCLDKRLVEKALTNYGYSENCIL